MIKSGITALGALAMSMALGTGYALAQEPGAEAGLQDGVYVRLAVGRAFAQDQTQAFTYNPDLLPLTTINSQEIAVGDGYAVGGAIGFDYGDGIRTELEYRFVSSNIGAAEQDTSAGPQTVRLADNEQNTHFLMSNFFFDFDTQTPLTPFIGGGVGAAFVKNVDGQRDSAFAFQGRAGLTLKMSDSVAFDAEYIYLQTATLGFGPNADEFTPAGPSDPAIDGGRYKSSLAMLSVRKRF